MALIKCKDCGNEVSKKATSCPKCGSPLKSKKKTSSFTILVLILIGSSWLYSTIKETTKTNTAPTPTKAVKTQKAKNTSTVTAITITTLNNKARLCPKVGCAQNKELLKIPTNTKLKVLSSSKERLPMWDVIWYKISYKNKTGWVSEFNTNKAPKEPRYRK